MYSPSFSSFQPMTQCLGSRRGWGVMAMSGLFGGAEEGTGRKRWEDMVKGRTESHQKEGP